MPLLGRVMLSPSGSSVGTFDFIVDPRSGVDVAIDTLVAADTAEGVVVGVVTDMKVVGQDADPLRAVNGPLGAAVAPLTSAAIDALVATVQVFHSPSMRPVRSGTVRPAVKSEVDLATGMSQLEWPVPLGLTSLADGTPAAVCTDGYTLLGPEGAHLMCAGRSGMAAKTSYISVLLRSVMEKGTSTDRVAALLFNVKGPDLVFLDEPPAAGFELTEEDRAMYAALGVPATPFEDVTVYAPALPGGTATRSERADAVPLRWGLKDVWRYLRFIYPSLFSNDNSVALIEDLANHKIYSPSSGVDSVDAVVRFLEAELADAEESGNSTIWHNHHVATARKVLKLVQSIPERTGGLVSKSALSATVDVPVEHFTHGQVVVVDIAGLEPLVQSVVIASTLDRLHKQTESKGIGVNHLVVFADELNVFAPSVGGDVPKVKDLLAKIAATGRYAGVSLWGAAQFMSQVHNQVRDNAATWAVGVLAEAELDSGVYGRVPAGRRERIVTLPKGTMAVKAYNLRGLMTVRFPRPAWRTGKPRDGRVVRKDETAVLDLSETSLERLSEGLDPDQVAQVIARHDGDYEATVRELEALRTPNMRKVSVEGATSYDRESVWDLD